MAQRFIHGFSLDVPPTWDDRSIVVLRDRERIGGFYRNLTISRMPFKGRELSSLRQELLQALHDPSLSNPRILADRQRTLDGLPAWDLEAQHSVAVSQEDGTELLIDLVRRQIAVLKGDAAYGITITDTQAFYSDNKAQYEALLDSIALP